MLYSAETAAGQLVDVFTRPNRKIGAPVIWAKFVNHIGDYEQLCRDQGEKM